jgi:cytochrome c oxidase assembly protein subunit 15
MPGMNDTDRRFMLLRRMAWICAALVIAITSLSAYLRLTKAGLGCADWPQCYGQSLRAQQRGAPVAPDEATATATARLAHRGAAVAALLLVIMMAMTCLASRPLLWREGLLALALLGCALFLTVLGVWTAGARVPAVTLGNLLGGFVLLALCWRMAQGAGRSRPNVGALAAWAWLGVVLLLAQISLGGLVSASFAGLSCPELARCNMSGASWQSLDPWREPVLDAIGATRPAGALSNGLHRAGALVVTAVLFALAILAWRGGRRAEAAWVLALLAAQAALGMMLVALRLPLVVALGHNLVAALLLAIVLGLTLARPSNPAG